MYAPTHTSMHKHKKYIKLYSINCILNECVPEMILGILTVACSSPPGEFFILSSFLSIYIHVRAHLYTHTCLCAYRIEQRGVCST